MIKSTLNWNGNPAQAVAFDAGTETLKRIVLFYFNALTGAVSVPNSGVRHRRKRTTKAGKKGSQYTTYPNSSAPGEPPRLRTAHLRAGLRYEFSGDKLTARVGSDQSTKYAAWLEYGTRKMAARPFLIATLNKVMNQLRALAGS